MIESIELCGTKYKVFLENDCINYSLEKGTPHSYISSDDIIRAMFHRIRELEKSVEEYKYDIEHGLAR